MTAHDPKLVFASHSVKLDQRTLASGPEADPDRGSDAGLRDSAEAILTAVTHEAGLLTNGPRPLN